MIREPLGRWGRNDEPQRPAHHKHKAFGCVAQPALASPSGGRDFPPAIAQRALFLLSLIQALARWSSEESLKVYARLNPSDYAAWITKASTQRTDSTTARHMPPLIDEYVIMESFLAAEDIFKRAEARFATS